MYLLLGVFNVFATSVLNQHCYIFSFPRFNLMGITFFDGQHYRAAVKRCDQAWYQYDRLWERNRPSTGLQKVALSTPAGFVPSSCFYVHSTFV